VTPTRAGREAVHEEACELVPEQRPKAVERSRTGCMGSGEGCAVLEQKLGPTVLRLRLGGEHGPSDIAPGEA
jgi:hypothetical protein